MLEKHKWRSYKIKVYSLRWVKFGYDGQIHQTQILVTLFMKYKTIRSGIM